MLAWTASAAAAAASAAWLARRSPRETMADPPGGRTAVGLLVHTWHDLDRVRRLQSEPGAGWGWWGRPAFSRGAYSWANDAMIDYHVDNWKALGVDFVFLDFTNGKQEAIVAGAHALCRRLRARGDGPAVAFWIQRVEDAPDFRRWFYDAYPSITFRWKGKPLLLVNGVHDGWRPVAGRPRPPPRLPGFTARWCWGLLGAAAGTMWSFKDVREDAAPYVSPDGAKEQMGLAFASQATHMTTPAGRRCREGGRFFAAQLAHARRHRPQLVTITGYNEWMSIDLAPRGGKPVYTDLWGAECSHDVEPMRGGHGDAYFRRARDAVRAIKAW